MINKELRMASKLVIGIGPVKIPGYQDRPQIVTQDKEKVLKFAQFDRWGEPLDLGLARLIREDLAVNLPTVEFTSYPWYQSMPVKYQVVVDILKLESDLSKDLILVTQWQILDVQTTKMVLLKSSTIHQPIIPPGYPGLTKALSTACTALSSEIAEALAQLDDLPH